jgi:hypothetical protein
MKSMKKSRQISHISDFILKWSEKNYFSIVIDLVSMIGGTKSLQGGYKAKTEREG